MRWFRSERASVSAEDERILKATIIDDQGRPGPILHDFAVCLDYIESHDLTLTATHQLPLRVLPEINARLTRPIEHGLKRPQPKSYPHLQGLYLLLRASGLTLVEASRGKPRLRLDHAVAPAWQTLGPVERYGSLLEAWLLRGQPEIIGEAHRWTFGIPDHFQDVAYLLDWIPDGGLAVGDDSDVQDRLRFTPGTHNLGLLDLFGLITIQPGPPIAGQGWQIARIERTPFGRALWTCLQAHFFGDFDRILALESQGETLVGSLQSILQPYWPAWQTNLTLPKWQFRDGVHVFRVALGRPWRRIAIPASLPLDSLASTILQAFDFDDHSHLYRFSYQNRFGILERVNHPDMDEGLWSSEVRIGDLPLGIGQLMTYLFDFGDSWEFTVTLEHLDPKGAVDQPIILEGQGKPPAQHPN